MGFFKGLANLFLNRLVQGIETNYRRNSSRMNSDQKSEYVEKMATMKGYVNTLKNGVNK